MTGKAQLELSPLKLSVLGGWIMHTENTPCSGIWRRVVIAAVADVIYSRYINNVYPADSIIIDF